MSADERAWWDDAVVYEVYPRSFADSNGDGVGDIAGVRSRLPYLSWLGVDAIWLTPFYPSPLADGGYDVSDYCDVDPLLGTLADFDALVAEARAHGIRVIIDLVPNHSSVNHPLFRAALAAGPGSRERARFIFRDAPGGEPPNNWPSQFGGPAWTRVPDGQWYLHLYDSSQPDWNWLDPDVPAFFEKVIRFWLDRDVAGLRVDVAHGLFKDPDLPDNPPAVPGLGPSAYRHRPELHALYRSWRSILDSYPPGVFPGRRTAIGEVWYDEPDTLRPYLEPGGLPQVFNFQLISAPWDTAALRAAIDATRSLAGGSRAPWVLGNHDVTRPVTRYARGEADDPERGERRARAAVLLLLALPGSAYIYQGEELGLPEVLALPPGARADPRFRRSGGERIGRDGCRVPLPWSAGGASFGFSGTSAGDPQASPWLPQPGDWGRRSVEAQRAEPGSFLSLYRAALRLRRGHPALGAGAMRWLDGVGSGSELLCFAREPGFIFAANLGRAPAALPPYREVLLASGEFGGGVLPPDTAAWLAG
ncbi:MAG: glycoside hydrolase family 13 protein [Streptosporangiaceae bacterium]|nr:glycoside hydrolase family 13 protein [Streptosporangiaceae bacterium]MBV9854390.1 glycoside hydrolase family 13 protein [Streptosporangiaceae bacterium]